MTEKKIYGLLGQHLGHSFSERYFNDMFRQMHLDARYVNFELDDIGDLMELVSETPGLSGLNVTIPYKESIIPWLSGLKGVAREIGAVNVVSFDPLPSRSSDFKMWGWNTDAGAFSKALSPLVENLDAAARSALVLGTGGASKAVMYALAHMGFRARTVSRHPSGSSLSYDEVTPQLIRDTPLIVNATPLGMWPDTRSCPPIPYEAMTARNICFDLVYNPEETEFMRRSALRGATVSNGLTMLHLQADEAWRIWNS